MNQLQKSLYEMLIEIDDICRKNNIEYYLGGGAALGAVRHEEFIPWDDDIDIWITRDNWIKLEKVLESMKIKDRALFTMYNTKDYCNPIPRYNNLNTTQVFKSQIYCGKSLGQAIEFFILDPMPADYKKANKMKTIFLIYTELLTPYFVINSNITNVDHDFNYNLYKYYYRISKIIGLKATLKKMEKKIFCYPQKGCELLQQRWGIEPSKFPIRMIGTPRLQKFEDREFYIPEKTEEIMRLEYGDTWMYIPEERAQIVHEFYTDLNIPFEEYKNQYMPKLDKPKIFKAYREDKAFVMENLIKIEKYVRKRLELKRLLLQEEFIMAWSENKEKIEEAIKNNDIATLDEKYKAINAFLFLSETKKKNGIVYLEEDMLYPYFYSLLKKGMYSEVSNLFKRYRLNGIEFKSEKNVEIKENAMCYRRVSQNIYDTKEIKKANDELVKISDKFKDNVVYKRYFYIIQVELCKNDKNKLKALKSELEKEVENNFDGELCKLLGDCFYYNNETDKAKELYEKAAKNTRNGIMLLDMYKKTGNKEFMVVE